MANPSKEKSVVADGSSNPMLSDQQAKVTSITDSTGGTAGDTVDDTTASVKDDIATLAAKINSILAILEAHGLMADA